MWACLGAGLLAACGSLPDPSDDDAVGSAAGELAGANGLTIDGLNTNGLASNGLPTTALITSGLPPHGLGATTLAALRETGITGNATRLFFRYLVSCALPAGHAVTFTWTDAAGVVRRESASGQFNLA